MANAYKAQKTGFVMRGKYSDIVEYEYRGEKYEVEYAKGFTYCCTAPSIQHKNAQAAIDEELDNPKPDKEYRYEDTAEYGFELFWKYINEQ